MAIPVTRDVVSALARAAHDAHPQEACGILTGKRVQNGAEEITAFIPARNVHPSPETHFEIDPQALIDAHRAARTGDGPEVLGYFHSHPTGPAQPSETDIAMSAGDGMIWAIAGLSEGGRALGLYRAVEGGFELLCRQPLEG